jgi:hypothetical protein
MPPDFRARFAELFARPRNRVLLALLLFAVVVRIGLPYVLRPLIVSQADEALVGRIELADLDLSLLRGGVTLHGLEVHTGERPAPGETEPPALFEAKRLWTQISWIALLRKTIDVEEFELEGFQVRLDRQKDGLVLPKPVPSDTPPEPEPENPEPLGWSFAADSVAFRDGGIHFADYTVPNPPQLIDLDVKEVAAQELALEIDPSGREPGQVVLNAQIADGALALDARVESRKEGPAITSKITLVNLPVGRARAYLQLFGWSELSARLDAEIEHRFETGGAHELGGHVALSKLAVNVPDLERPALAFDKLDVNIGKIDLVNRHAAVSEVALLAPRVVIDPRAKPAEPLLTPPPHAGEAAPPPVEPEQGVAVEVHETKPWTWAVDAVRLERGVVELGIPDPLELGVDAEVKSLSSEPGSRWPVRASVSEGAGKLGVDGALAIQPVAFDGKLTLADFALPPLLARLDAPGVSLVRKGDARADLTIALGSDLEVSGTLGLANLDVGEPESKDFAASWQDFELDIRELTVSDALGAEPTKPRTIAAKLDLVKLAQPAVVITRTKDGIALPPLGAAEKAEAAPAPEATPPAESAPAAPAAPGPTISIEVADVRVDQAKAQIADRSVTPFYRGRIDRFDVRAKGVRWPERRIDSLVAHMKGLQGATLDVKGKIAPGGSQIDAKLVELPLGPFNPYVTSTGYSLAGGALSLDTKAKLGREDYDSTTDVRIHELAVGGSEGESLFQQNFGIPLSVALGLLKDLNGDITLSVPVAGDREGTRVPLRGLVAQALRKALMGALASPLKLLGAITKDGKVQSLAPAPIAFVAGTADLAPGGDERLDQVASLLAASPGITLTLRGSASAEDVRALQEQDLLVELRDSFAIGTKRAVRKYLEARAKGEPAELDDDGKAWLDEHASEIEIAPARLTALCGARAKAAQQALVSESGIAVERLKLGDAQIEPPATLPSVAIGLGAEPAGTPQVGASKPSESK